jgi:hypothetical protein
MEPAKLYSLKWLRSELASKLGNKGSQLLIPIFSLIFMLNHSLSAGRTYIGGYMREKKSLWNSRI